MKNSEHKQLDQLLKDKLSEGTAQVPDFVWDRIEEELFPERKRRRFFWWFFGGCCILIIGVLVAITVSGQQANASTNASFLLKFSSGQKSEKSPKDRKSTDNSSSSANENTNRIAPSDQSSDYRSAHSNPGSRRKFILPNRPKKWILTKERKSAGSQNEGSLHSIFLPGEETTDKITPATVISPPKEKNENSTVKTEPKNEVPETKEISYAEIVELVKRDFQETSVETIATKRPSFFSIGLFGGPSLYHSAVFKDYFTSGQLSKRTFASSGFEFGLQARFKVGNHFKIYAGLAFNQKQTQFSYNLAITQADYFTYVVNNELIPFENVRDDGMNSCFLAKDVTAKFNTQSVLISLGTSVEFLKIGKFSAAADIRLSGNVSSSLKLREVRVLDIAQPASEKFSYLQPGVGLLLNYRLNSCISLGLAPSFSKQLYLKTSFSRKMDELVIPLSISFDF